MTANALLPGGDPAQWVRNLLHQPSERDQQRLIGPSSIGDPCSRCVAEQLAGVDRPQGRYWVGARFGTAIHQALEDASTGIPGVLPERKVTLGEVPGYGVIKGTADSTWVEENHLIDFKTTTRDKLVFIKEALLTAPEEGETKKVASARHKVKGYIGQIMLYAWAAGGMEKVSLVFLCRDGKTDEDIWSRTLDYDEDYALQCWNRLLKIWDALQSGRDIESFVSAQYCYTCST